MIDSPPPVSPYIDGITMLAAQAELNNALYLYREGRSDDARRIARRSIALRPDFQQGRAFLAGIGE